MTTKKTSKTAIQISGRNKFAFFLSVISILFLFPGIYLSMLTIATKGSVTATIPHMETGFLGIPKQEGTEDKRIPIKIFDTSRSILNTVHDLWQKHFFFVSSMIFLFSVIVPTLKGGLLTYIFFHKSVERRTRIFSFIKAIGKWSMCDVFIVAVLLSYLSTGATQTENTKNVMFMGHSVSVDVVAGMHAQLHVGFWCFLTYCLLSLLALQLYEPH
ncbi:MAG: paraquat-inducible protein A [Pseudomonadota bacterium]